MAAQKKIAIGADHGGFELKEKIKKMLKRGGYGIYDAGTKSSDPCDYPVYGFDAAKEVSTGKAWRGIVICKSGIGMSMIANKLPGVRAALCSSIPDAVSSREHNDANVLVLGANKVAGKKALDLVAAWLATKSLPGRHARRVRQIKELEKKVFKKAHS